MATNIPAKNFDTIGFTLSNVGETAVTLPDANACRLMYMQCTSAQDIFVTRTPGATTDPTNRWTIKSGQALILEDVEIKPMSASGIFWYARGGVDAIVLEVIYAQG